MKFGILTLQHYNWTETIQIWQKIEELGFDSIWLADHFINFMQPEGPWFDCWTLLPALASQTKTIRIGTLVSSLPLHHPGKLARQAMTVDHISNGRLELGIGAGASSKEGELVYDMLDIEEWEPKERVARFSEAIQIISSSLSQQKVSFEGEYYKIKNMNVVPQPIQQPRIPITIGAMGKKMLRIAAQYADRWNSFGAEWGAPPEIVVANTKKRISIFKDYCIEFGRDYEAIDKSLLLYGSEAETVFLSEENFKEVVERYKAIGITELIFYYPFFDPKQVINLESIATNLICKSSF